MANDWDAGPNQAVSSSGTKLKWEMTINPGDDSYKLATKCSRKDLECVVLEKFNKSNRCNNAYRDMTMYVFGTERSADGVSEHTYWSRHDDRIHLTIIKIRCARGKMGGKSKYSGHEGTHNHAGARQGLCTTSYIRTLITPNAYGNQDPLVLLYVQL